MSIVLTKNGVLKVGDQEKDYVKVDNKIATIQFYCVKFVDNKTTKIVDKPEEADLLTSQYIFSQKEIKSAKVKINGTEYTIRKPKSQKVSGGFITKLRIFTKSSAITAEVTFDF